MAIVGLYLSPERYIYGQDAEHFFNEASVNLGEFDLLVGSGDINAEEMIDFYQKLMEIYPLEKILN